MVSQLSSNAPNGYSDWCRFCGIYRDGLFTDVYGFKCQDCRNKEWEEIRIVFDLISPDEVWERNQIGRD